MTEATEVENAMYELADNACRALGVDPDKVEDPVGPVTARENVIYAMYKHAENIEATRQSSVPVQGERERVLLEALKDVSRRIKESDEWWMDCPDRGGFDAMMIDAAIAQAQEPSNER